MKRYNVLIRGTFKLDDNKKQEFSLKAFTTAKNKEEALCKVSQKIAIPNKEFELDSFSIGVIKLKKHTYIRYFEEVQVKGSEYYLLECYKKANSEDWPLEEISSKYGVKIATVIDLVKSIENKVLEKYFSVTKLYNQEIGL